MFARSHEERNDTGLPHTFVVHSYRKPTICKRCGKLLLGLYKQGVQCRDCKVCSRALVTFTDRQVNAHRECAVELPYDCRTYTDLYAAPSMAQSLVSMTSSTARPMDTGDGELLTIDSPTDLIPVYRLPGQAMPTWYGVRVRL